jgi:hypothetical protein
LAAAFTPRLAHIVGSDGVASREDEAERAIGNGKRRCSIRRRLRRRRRYHQRRADLDQRQEAVAEIVGAEAVRVENESHPRPPDGAVESEIDQRPVTGDPVLEAPCELIDRDDEHEVEEELEPGGRALPFLLASDPWRLVQRPLDGTMRARRAL